MNTSGVNTSAKLFPCTMWTFLFLLYYSANKCEFYNVIGLTSVEVEKLQPETEIETLEAETKDQSSETENLEVRNRDPLLKVKAIRRLHEINANRS